MTTRCPHCGCGTEIYIYNLWNHDTISHTEQWKLIQELEDLGYTFKACENCAQVFIVKEN